jgi:hypothetical protein
VSALITWVGIENRQSVAILGFPILEVFDPAKIQAGHPEPVMAILIVRVVTAPALVRRQRGLASHTQAIISPMIA